MRVVFMLGIFIIVSLLRSAGSLTSPNRSHLAATSCRVSTRTLARFPGTVGECQQALLSLVRRESNLLPQSGQFIGTLSGRRRGWKWLYLPFNSLRVGVGRKIPSAYNNQSATTLLPGQDNPAPSSPMSGASWFVVSCGVRLSEVGLWEIRKSQVIRSIRYVIGSCGLHHPSEGDSPWGEGVLANPLKSRWGHQKTT